MNNYYFNKSEVLIFLKSIRKSFINNKGIFNQAFKLDFEEWEFSIEFDKLISIIDDFIENKKYLPVFSKQQIVDGFGKIVLVSNQNPYLILNFVLSCIYTNNKVEVALERKMLATNKVILENIMKVIKDKKFDEDTVSYIEVTSKEDIIYKQNNYDLLYYFGNKEEYLTYIKRINIDSKFENYGEIYVYAEDHSFQDMFMKINNFASINEIHVRYVFESLEDGIKEINKKNNICKIAIIFTKNIELAYKFIKEIKAENVYININPCENFKYEINMENLVFRKEINIK